MKPNWPLLAGLRFALASIVLLSHTFAFSNPPWLLVPMQLSSFAAVCAFLCISGYSIRHSITKRREGYFHRRLNRIYPVYLFCLVLSMVPFFIGGDMLQYRRGGAIEAPSLGVFCAQFFMMQSIVAASIPTLGTSWTLAIEEWHYLIAPLLLKIPRKATWAAIAVSALGYYSTSSYIYPSNVSPVGLFCMSFFWMIGWQVAGGLTDWERTVAVALPTAALCVNPQQDFRQWGSVTVAVTVLALIHGGELRLPAKLHGPLNWLGDVSYPLYMVHGPVFWLVLLLLPSSEIFVYLSAACAAAVAIYILLDKPLRLPKAQSDRTGIPLMPIPQA